MIHIFLLFLLSTYWSFAVAEGFVEAEIDDYGNTLGDLNSHIYIFSLF
jgi:hypothetical protein